MGSGTNALWTRKDEGRIRTEAAFVIQEGGDGEKVGPLVTTATVVTREERLRNMGGFWKILECFKSDGYDSRR
jgi:hypothetical protein